MDRLQLDFSLRQGEEYGNEAEPWFDLFLSGIGFVPELGSALKGIVKLLKRGADDIDVTGLKPILGPFADRLGELVQNFPGYAEDAEKYARLIVGDLASKAEQTAKTLRGYIKLDPTGKLKQFVDKLDEVTRTLEEIRSLIGDKFREIADEILGKLERIKARGEGVVGADEPGVPRRGIVEGELTRLNAGEGHTLIVTRSGKIFRCSSCDELGVQFAELLEENPELAERLRELEGKYQRIAAMDEAAEADPFVGLEQDNLKLEADEELKGIEEELSWLGSLSRSERQLFEGRSQAEIDEMRKLMELWSPATFDDAAENILYHFPRKGYSDPLEYLRDAANFDRSGAIRYPRQGFRDDDTVRWSIPNTGEYIVEDNKGKIRTYGFNE